MSARVLHYAVNHAYKLFTSNSALKSLEVHVDIFYYRRLRDRCLRLSVILPALVMIMVMLVFIGRRSLLTCSFVAATYSVK